jgi:hypothetical protein
MFMGSEVVQIKPAVTMQACLEVVQDERWLRVAACGAKGLGEHLLVHVPRGRRLERKVGQVQREALAMDDDPLSSPGKEDIEDELSEHMQDAVVYKHGRAASHRR